MKAFGDVLKDLRQQKGLSQVQLGKVFNVRNTTISAWETAITEPDIETIIKLAKYFEVTTDYLLGLED